MDDESLDALIDSATGASQELSPTKARRQAIAFQVITQITFRLARGKRLTVKAMRALISGLVDIGLKDDADRFLFPGSRRRGRPEGSTKKTDFWHAFALYGAAKGYIPEERAPASPRELQRIRRKIRGTSGKPGRPKKTDNK